MRLNRWLILLALLFVFAQPLSMKAQTVEAGGPAKIDDERLARILQNMQAKLDESRASLKFPGATVAFVLPDGRTGAVSTGFADLETKRSLKPSDRLLAGSIGKTFVAAVTLELVEEGKLKLDEKIERWLGTEPWFKQLPNAHEITLRMLLNHSSGIPNHVELDSFLHALFKTSARGDVRYEELLTYVLNKKPLFPAGKGYSYADTNYILVGLIVERVTHNTLYDEVTRRILKPLKLDRTIPSNSLVLPEVANGYFEGKPIIVKGRFKINPQWEWAGGGFASTPEDLARWARALYGGEVLRPATLNEMLQSTTTGEEGAHYGLGVDTSPGKWGQRLGHDGEFPGYLSDMRYFPQYKIAVAVQVNADETTGASKFMASATDDFAQIVIREIQDRKLSEADQAKLQGLAESWLKLIDAGRYEESWEELSAELRAKYPKEKWRDTMRPFLQKTGKIRTRKFKAIDYSDPESDAVAVDFESSFAKLATAFETVFLKLEKDGRWRVSSYSIK